MDAPELETVFLMDDWDDTDRRWEKGSTPEEQLELFMQSNSPEITALANAVLSKMRSRYRTRSNWSMTSRRV